MTDPNDPFAAQPYVPPTQRDAEASDPSSAPRPSDAAPSDPASSGGAPSPEPTSTAPSYSVPPAGTPGQPDASPAAWQQPPAQPPVSPSAPQPAGDPFTHRFEAQAPGQPTGPSSDEPTVTFPTAQQPAQPQGQTPYGSQAPYGQPGAQDHGQPPHDPFGLAAAAPAAPAPRKRRGGRVLAGALAIAVLAVAGGVGGAWAYDEVKGDDGTSAITTLDASDKGDDTPAGQVEKVAAAVLPSVVQINVSGSGEAGSGTGIIISSDGEILTNNHVVEVAADGGTVTVAFSDGTNAKAKILGRDPKTDLAVIKVEGKTGLKPATLGNSADLKVGQDVVAIGSPFGLESTVTSGIISALNRPVASSDGSGGDATVFPAVQTDAAINPGNSGGPLVDLEGRVIAINSAIRSNGTSSSDSGSIGLGFAIPIDLARNVARHLVKGEKVEHAQIGVTVSPAVSSDDITGIGAQIERVTPDSAGAKAGLKKGDIITAVNGNPVGSSNALVASIRGYQPGETVTVTYQRNGRTSETKVTLQSDGGETAS